MPASHDPRSIRFRRAVLPTSLATILVIAAGGCSSSSTTAAADPAGSGSAVSGSAKLPERVTQSGELIVGSQINYPPMEYFGPNGTTIKGADYELILAIGKELGLKVKIVNNEFPGLIPGLQSGRFDAVISSMTDNRKRENVVTFVDYFAVGTGIVVPAGNPRNIDGLMDLCGRTAVLPQATIQVTIAQAQQPKCAKAGKQPIRIKQVPTPAQGFVQLESGTSDANMVDYPVAAHNAAHSDGKLQVLPAQVGSILPYGIAFPKSGSQGLINAVRTALHTLVKNGTYAAILKKYGVSKGGISPADMVVNGAKS